MNTSLNSLCIICVSASLAFISTCVFWAILCFILHLECLIHWAASWYYTRICILYLMPYCYTAYPQMFMLVLLYVHYMTYLCVLLVFSIGALGNNILNIYKGIKFPTTDYVYFLLDLCSFCLMLVPSFIIMLDPTLLKLRNFIFIAPIYLFQHLNFSRFHHHFVVSHVWTCIFVLGSACSCGASAYTHGVIFSAFTTVFSICWAPSWLGRSCAVTAFSCILLIVCLLMCFFCYGFVVVCLLTV